MGSTTFSSIVGSFGKLQNDVWLALKQKYGERIYGLEHRTVSVSPIKNALDLVKNLPNGARLHLVSHSRGGMVGELLCRSGRVDGPNPFDELDFGLGYTELTRNILKDLSKELKNKKIKVERFVRVACPVSGTTLGSGRLDRWLELMINVIGKVTGASATVAFGVILDLLLDVKKQNANPEAMPGLAAMATNSALIRMLNRPDIQIDSHLVVISGVVTDSGTLNHLKAFCSDNLGSEDHDLVFSARSMFGGARRVSDGYYFNDQDENVDHFHYFSNPRTANKLLKALESDWSELERDNFRPISEARKLEATNDSFSVS